MAKIRVYELARELDLESKAVLARAHDLGIEAKTASSGLEEDEAELVRLSYGDEPNGAAPEPAAAAPPAETEEPSIDEAPVAGEPEQEPEQEPEPTPTEESPVAEPSAEESPAAEAPEAESPVAAVTVQEGATPEEFAEVIDQPVGEVVKALLQMGEMVGAGSAIPVDAFELLGDHFGVTIEVTPAEAPQEEAAATRTLVKPKRQFDDDPSTLEPRPPVVTAMGHVDHGKTTLLDTIRKTNVVAGEHGGITQHIGAYQVEVNARKITFLDTPGHEAFTALRARGAEVTDIVILVVAADDGVMPQTAEAISHAKAAGVTMIVAINKVDLPGADPYAVRAQLTEFGLVAEELGGDTITVEVSATTGQGVDQLLEMIDLIAQLEEFSARAKAPASGVVIESQLDPGRGPVGTVIIQRGTLKPGDALVAEAVAGRVRAMLDEHGNRLKSAGPSSPVLIMGWDEVPTAGDLFEVVKDYKAARARAAERHQELREEEMVVPTARERLEQLLEQLRTADEAELRLIVKADAHGSLEAIREAVAKIAREGGHITVIHGAVGGIGENDIGLAEVTESVVVGFNVRPDSKARKAAEESGVEIRTYQVIYEMLDEIEQMLVGRLAPEEVERVLGAAEVRAVFRVPRAGNVAGSYVTEGEINRGAKVRLVRQGVVVYDGIVSSLRRFKDDVRSVSAGFECGIGLHNYDDVKEGDVIEAYEIREVARE